jgi:hypothetical protein
VAGRGQADRERTRKYGKRGMYGIKESRWQQVELVKFYGLPGAMTPQDGKKIINK